MYQPSWTHADSAGRVVAGEHSISATDMRELADAINRRRRLVCLAEEDFSSQASAGLPVCSRLLNTEFPPPFTNFRYSLEGGLLNAQPGGFGGNPCTPLSMEWRWPVADSDENRVIVNGFTGVGSGDVSLFTRLNGSGDWTNPSLLQGVHCIRAVHVNELRQSLEWMRRGRWRFPFYGEGGILKSLPDQPSVANAVGNDGQDELRCVGYFVMRTDENPPRGLTDVTVRSSSSLTVTADYACQLAIYRCKRPVRWGIELPTWNHNVPSENLCWQTPGGLGGEDAEWLGSIACQAGQPANLTGSTLACGVQHMLNGEPQNLLIRRSDTGINASEIAVELTVEFDLDSPPN